MMIDLGPHAGYIVTAYFGVSVVTLGLIAALLINSRTRKRQLDRLEAGRKAEADS